jgi:hypothetical protein
MPADVHEEMKRSGPHSKIMQIMPSITPFLHIIIDMKIFIVFKIWTANVDQNYEMIICIPAHKLQVKESQKRIRLTNSDSHHEQYSRKR